MIIAGKVPPDQILLSCLHLSSDSLKIVLIFHVFYSEILNFLLSFYAGSNSPSDYHLLPSLKQSVGGYRFKDFGNVDKVVTQ
jgi:hypothetical protein